MDEQTNMLEGFIAGFLVGLFILWRLADLVAALQSRRIPLEINPTAVAQSICDSRPEAQEKSCS